MSFRKLLLSLSLVLLCGTAFAKDEPRSFSLSTSRTFAPGESVKIQLFSRNVPEFEFRLVVAVAGVAAALRVPADVRDLIQHHASTGRLTQGSTSKGSPDSIIPARSDNFQPSIGMRTPLSAATVLASSYPASTCRMTPIPGSLVSTRSIFCAASGVPSATVT